MALDGRAWKRFGAAFVLFFAATENIDWLSVTASAQSLPPSTPPNAPPKTPAARPNGPSTPPSTPGARPPGNQPPSTPNTAPKTPPSVPTNTVRPPSVPAAPMTPAQQAKPNTTTTKPPANNAASNKPANAAAAKLEPKVVNLVTKDGVQLRTVYFPSDKGKKAVPVMLLHEFDGQSAPFVNGANNVPALATLLQQSGFAVISPDLRGHGGSLAQADPRGGTIELDRSKFNKRDILAMMQGDMEAVKQFLKTENDEGNLNLNALVVLGVQDSSVLAMNWTAMDWEWPAVPGKKQGQDVKAIVLLSPEKLNKGVPYEPMLKHPVVSRLPTLLIAGAQSEQGQRLSELRSCLRRLALPTRARQER